MNSRARAHPLPQPGALSRRQCLVAGAGALMAGGATRRALAHTSFGPVTPPAAAPSLTLTSAEGAEGGKPTSLHSLLKGHVTAVQLMFTGCSATCPIQGAIFADAQTQLAAAGPELRLLSLSIDPLADSPQALKQWLGRFNAQPARWAAAVPRMQDVDALIDFLRGRASGADKHTAQAFLFDRQARLAFRTADMPAGGDLASLMQQLAARR